MTDDYGSQSASQAPTPCPSPQSPHFPRQQSRLHKNLKPVADAQHRRTGICRRPDGFEHWRANCKSAGIYVIVPGCFGIRTIPKRKTSRQYQKIIAQHMRILVSHKLRPMPKFLKKMKRIEIAIRPRKPHHADIQFLAATFHFSV